MAETIKRKCDECKGEIIIERNKMRGPILFKKKYYHHECFCQFCERKSSTPRGLPFWQNVLNEIETYKDDAVQMSIYQFSKDDLNEWILSHYNVMNLPCRFWNIVADLEKGIYNKKQCKPVSVDILYHTWRWGQKNLDSINRKNKQNRTGPKTDSERVNYDLAIVVNHIPDYLKAKARHDAEEAERKEREKEKSRINYKNIYIEPKKKEGIGNLADILDEFF